MDISSLTEVVNQWLAAQTKLPDGTVISIKLTTFGAKVGVLKPAEVYLKADEVLSPEVLDTLMKHVSLEERWCPSDISKGLLSRIQDVLLTCSWENGKENTMRDFFFNFPTQEDFKKRPRVGSKIVTTIAEGILKNTGYTWPEK